MKKIYLVALLIVAALHSEARTTTTFKEGWRFTRSDNASYKLPDWNDSAWQTVTVPHDWAIYGPFSWDNDRQNVAITQDGQKEAMEHAGRTGGLPFVGTGWYRLNFDIPQFKKGQRATLVFDGAMSGAQVWLNGREVGKWPYGYNSFYFDVTRYARRGDNLLAVRLENLPESSRWYPGAGLYRNVRLIITEGAHIPVWGTYITTELPAKDMAKINVRTEIVLPRGADTTAFRLRTVIENPVGMEVAHAMTPVINFQFTGNAVEQHLFVSNPDLWTVDTPNLYTAQIQLIGPDGVTDEMVQDFGIRTIEIRPDDGFYLNGEKIKFKGVCNHSDLGPLGMAVNKSAIERQIRILKDMGCNAIRTSHNMPAPELVEACDRMGMMLMVESFDEWKQAKCKNGYHRLYDDWMEQDLTNLVRHYRCNPSVVMWCIGNEVPDQWNESGSQLAYNMQRIVHQLDPTRPVTQGMDAPDAVLANNMAATMDVAGFNYRPFRYQEEYRKLPQQLILGTETASTVSSRGVYKFPVERKAMATYPDHQSSSYDVEHCGWSELPEDNFILHDDLPYTMGEFVWTGFDYLGEPTPYYTNWPSHSSLFGIIDLAGIPKDRYYLYRSHWNPEAETLHILPHWTWPGHEGDTIPVMVYTNYPEAELFINGVSQGRRKKDMSVTIDSTLTDASRAAFERQKRYRLMWMDTRYKPGTLKVVAYDADGKPVAERKVSTAGKPDHIELSIDRDDMLPNGEDLAFITVRVVDKKGNLCPDADNLISFTTTGAGTFHAVANGDPSSLESFQEPQMHVFHGMLTAIVKAGKTDGTITFTATSPGLKPATISVEVF